VIYLDANATTPLHPEVRAVMLPLLGEVFGNPSSVHSEGQRARSEVDRARERCARVLGVQPKELVFTSGGTEAAALALLGVARAALEARRLHGGSVGNPGSQHLEDPLGLAPLRVVTSTVEHACVVAACSELETLGIEVVRVGVDGEGRLELAGLEAALAPGALLCSVMAANNETGVLTPLAEVSRLCRARGVPLHTDAVQLAGKGPLDVRALGVDLLSLSAHKVRGPKGAGLLWVRKGLRLRPLLAGGHQERGRRGGTENALGAVGLGAALELAERERAETTPRVAALRDRLEACVRAIAGVRVLGAGADRVANTLCVVFEGCEGETLLAALDLAGVAVSTGSACSSGTLEASHVLLAMGVPKALAKGAVRFSLWSGNTQAELDQVCALLPSVVGRVRHC
jgi:cysteine desulfurase